MVNGHGFTASHDEMAENYKLLARPKFKPGDVIYGLYQWEHDLLARGEEVNGPRSYKIEQIFVSDDMPRYRYAHDLGYDRVDAVDATFKLVSRTPATNTDDLKRSIKNTERQLERLKAELESASNPYGEDLFAEGTLLRFSIWYPKMGRKYTYAALKAGRCWYMTRGEGVQRSWKELCDDLWKKYDVQPSSIVVYRPSLAGNETLADT